MEVRTLLVAVSLRIEQPQHTVRQMKKQQIHLKGHRFRSKFRKGTYRIDAVALGALGLEEFQSFLNVSHGGVGKLYSGLGGLLTCAVNHRL